MPGAKPKIRNDKRAAILKSSESLFATRRFHEVTLDAVARAASVGKGTIYLYFTDKEDLFFHTLTSGFEELCGRLNNRIPSEAPFREQLVGAGQEISRFFEGRRKLLRAVMSEEGRVLGRPGPFRERWLVQRKNLIAALAVVLDHGVKEGVLRTDVPSDVLARVLLGLLRTRARDLQEGPEAARSVEFIIDLFCHGALRSEAATEKGD